MKKIKTKKIKKRTLISLSIITITLLILLAGSFLAGRSQAPEIHNISDPNITFLEERFLDFSFTDLAGQRYAITDFKEQMVLLNFWATWCPPCIVELPQFYELARLYPEKTFILMSVDMNERNITDLLQKMKLDRDPPPNIIIAHDPKKEVSKNIFGTIVYPETILINRSGVMVYKIAGAANWLDEEIKEIIEKAALPERNEHKDQ